MHGIVASIRAQLLEYKGLAEGAIRQTSDTELLHIPTADNTSIAILCWHISGNLRSRFTDFLTTDGEKPWRKRDEEFVARTVTREELLAKWESGWAVLFETLDSLSTEDLEKTVAIRGKQMRAYEALHRALAHMAYHVGQIVYLAKTFRGTEWQSLSVPLGESEAFNRRMGFLTEDEAGS